ncbi:MAG: hypothetical protein JSR21_00050 [Proteobacteria bacterium]|nr:hypothetical protein [Pseudomonadota bacterium]
MGSPILLLGPVLFQDFEVPEKINFGGCQRLAVHKMPGGTRVVDVLGRDDASIRFSGIFSGTDATLRARLVDDLRASGLVVPLTWDVFFYTVIVSQFTADYSASTWIPYSITATVLRDEAGALIQSATDLGVTLLADASSAVGLASPAGVDLSSMQSALSDSAASTRGTASYGVAQSAVMNAQSTLGSAASTAAVDLPMTALTSPGPASAGIEALFTAVGAAGNLGQLSAAQGYVGRISSNLANAGT